MSNADRIARLTGINTANIVTDQEDTQQTSDSTPKTVQSLTTITTITTNNDYNNYNNINDLAESCNQEPYVFDACGSTRGASVSGESTISSQAFHSGNAELELGDRFSYVKLDLFNNVTDEEAALNKTKFKMTLTLRLEGKQEMVNFAAALSTPFRHLKHRIPNSPGKQKHLAAIESAYQGLVVELNCSNVFASRCYKPKQGIGKQKGNSIDGLSVVVGQTTEVGVYAAALIYKDEIHYAILKNQYLTLTQRKANMVATFKQNSNTYCNKSISVDDAFGN